MQSELESKGLKAELKKLGKGDYETTMTLASYLAEETVDRLDLLILDLNQREFQVLSNMIEDKSILKVSQIVVHAEFKPVWEENVLNWSKELNARALLHLDMFMEMEELGFKIMEVKLKKYSSSLIWTKLIKINIGNFQIFTFFFENFDRIFFARIH